MNIEHNLWSSNNLSNPFSKLLAQGYVPHASHSVTAVHVYHCFPKKEGVLLLVVFIWFVLILCGGRSLVRLFLKLKMCLVSHVGCVSICRYFSYVYYQEKGICSCTCARKHELKCERKHIIVGFCYS